MPFTYFTHLVPILQANYPKSYNTKLQNGGVRSTTLAIEIQKIINQLKDSKLLKKKENYMSLLTEMKKIYHTTVKPRGGCPKSKVLKCRG